MSSSTTVKPQMSYFEQQRELLLNDIALNLENVLQNINHLNRSLEGIIAVGNEFSQVEGLWSQFENVMAKPPASTTAAGSAVPQTASQGEAAQQEGDKTT